MRTLGQRLGLPPRGIRDTGGRYTSDGRAASRFLGYRVALPPASRDQFLAALRGDARDMLQRSANRVVFDDAVSSDKGRAGFRVVYQGRHSRGELVVRPVDLSNEELDVTIYVYEHLH